jgi:EmrB/QacA subfamily drug resistance transporter
MTTTPTSPTVSPESDGISDAVHRRRWTILAIVCVAVFVTVVDGTIVNIAIPTLAVELDATTRQLQWIVDAYLLVFTGLLLAAGGLGDRYGRKKMLLAGLVVFGITSAYAGSVGSANELIVGRALMGIGAALIFPATLAIITNVFRSAAERAKAIAIWSAVTGVAVAAGPITGGWLLEHFWWGSIFYINVPVVIVAVLGVALLVPESKEAHAPRLDLGGIGLSIAAITTLVFTIIEAPEWGWSDPRILGGFALAAALLIAFVVWELRREHPMLPVSIFRNLRFSAASVSVTSAFFALFGFIFLITQYFQLVKTYTPLEAGVRTLPVAISIAIASVVAPRIVERIGTSRVVSAGLASMSIAFLWIALSTDVDTSYLVIAGQMVFLGVGLGLTTAPATESIMGSLPPAKAGIGSAVNDTTRELGGTLGVAVIGSVFSSLYIRSLDDAGGVYGSLPSELQSVTAESVGAAGVIAGQLGADAPAFISQVNDAFLTGMHAACFVCAGVAFAGAIFANRFIPARAAQ